MSSNWRISLYIQLYKFLKNNFEYLIWLILKITKGIPVQLLVLNNDAAHNLSGVSVNHTLQLSFIKKENTNIHMYFLFSFTNIHDF